MAISACSKDDWANVHWTWTTILIQSLTSLQLLSSCLGFVIPPQQNPQPYPPNTWRPLNPQLQPQGGLFPQNFRNNDDLRIYQSGTNIPVNHNQANPVEDEPLSFSLPILYRNRNIPVFEKLVVTNSVNKAVGEYNRHRPTGPPSGNHGFAPQHAPVLQNPNPLIDRPRILQHTYPQNNLYGPQLQAPQQYPYSAPHPHPNQNFNSAQLNYQAPFIPHLNYNTFNPPPQQWDPRMNSNGGRLLLQHQQGPSQLSFNGGGGGGPLPPFRTVRNAPPGSFFIPTRAPDGSMMTYAVEPNGVPKPDAIMSPMPPERPSIPMSNNFLLPYSTPTKYNYNQQQNSDSMKWAASNTLRNYLSAAKPKQPNNKGSFTAPQFPLIPYHQTPHNSYGKNQDVMFLGQTPPQEMSPLKSQLSLPVLIPNLNSQSDKYNNLHNPNLQMGILGPYPGNTNINHFQNLDYYGQDRLNFHTPSHTIKTGPVRQPPQVNNNNYPNPFPNYFNHLQNPQDTGYRQQRNIAQSRKQLHELQRPSTATLNYIRPEWMLQGESLPYSTYTTTTKSKSSRAGSETYSYNGENRSFSQKHTSQVPPRQEGYNYNFTSFPQYPTTYGFDPKPFGQVPSQWHNEFYSQSCGISPQQSPPFDFARNGSPFRSSSLNPSPFDNRSYGQRLEGCPSPFANSANAGYTGIRLDQYGSPRADQGVWPGSPYYNSISNTGHFNYAQSGSGTKPYEVAVQRPTNLWQQSGGETWGQKEPTAYSQEPKTSILHSSRGEMSIYSQPQSQTNYGGLSQYNEAKEDNKYQSDSTILQRHLQRVKQILRNTKTGEGSGTVNESAANTSAPPSVQIISQIEESSPPRPDSADVLQSLTLEPGWDTATASDIYPVDDFGPISPLFLQHPELESNITAPGAPFSPTTSTPTRNPVPASTPVLPDIPQSAFSIFDVIPSNQSSAGESLPVPKHACRSRHTKGVRRFRNVEKSDDSLTPI